jgi:LysR family transcriptional regulator, benzoate and cis,cis-muconate-responsive activator of ben and cat genes
VILREERLVAAIPLDTPLAADTAPLPIEALVSHRLIVYPREPRPSFADQVLSLLHEHDVRPAEVQEVREIQTALGLVAAAAGVCVIPSSARQMRSDVHYRLLECERATSPVILNYRANDNGQYIDLIKRLIQEMYAEEPPWLGIEHNLPLRPSFSL